MRTTHYPHRLSSLRFRIFIFTLLLTGISFFLFCVIFTVSSSYLLRKSSKETAQMSLDRTVLFLQEQMSAFRNSLDTFTLNVDCINILDSSPAEESGELDRHLTYTVLENAINTVLFTSHISDIFIVTDNPLSTPQYGKLYPLTSFENVSWTDHLSSTKSSFIWDTPDALPFGLADEDYVVCTRNLPFTYQNYHTYVCGVISKSSFDELLNTTTLSPYISCYVINSSNDIIFGANQVPEDDMAALSLWFESQERISQLPHSVEQVSAGNHTYFVGFSPVKNTDLKVIYIYAFSEINHANTMTCIRQLGLIFLFILPVIFGFSTWISRHITKPLEKLKEVMMVASEGDFNIPILPGTKDEETNSLTMHFNYMLTKISGLLDEQYLNGQRMKDLELQALQAQINPHFLYNTLDLIRWRAIRNKDENTQLIIAALSNFYRTGLSKGNSFVTLETEISHIKSYVQLQNMRFDDCIHLTINIPADCYAYLIPKLTLQPIVENSIAHGILEKEPSEGNIIISCQIREALLILTVEDDGCGMDEETVHRLLLSPDTDASRHGYGLYNVNERIWLYYGKDFGLSFTSELGRGTITTITLPLKNDSAADVFALHGRKES